jgi:PTH1 family peptidyl-tRNA hydrolase
MKKLLIAGLGNIGPKYEDTRHNIGFKIADQLVEENKAIFETQRLGDIAKFTKKGKQFIVLKPSTLMNLSGKAVDYWLKEENIELKNLLVVTDDLNLGFGTLRLKTKGSDGGHNGLKDIQTWMNTSKYNRFRFGIGNDYSSGNQIGFVLNNWDDEERDKMKERMEQSVKLVETFGLAGPHRAMNDFNGS